MINERKILIGSNKIEDYVGRSWEIVLEWIKTKNFPVIRLGNRWESYPDDIDRWRKSIIKESTDPSINPENVIKTISENSNYPKLIKRSQEIKKLVRKGVAAELFRLRRNLNLLNEKTKEESIKISAWQKCSIEKNSEYPKPSLTFHKPTLEGIDLPETSGVYFIWDGSVVVYIGRTINFRQRLKLGSHHILEKKHLISFLEFEKSELTWMECYYIGILRPFLNFGSNGSHNRYEKLLTN